MDREAYLVDLIRRLVEWADSREVRGDLIMAAIHQLPATPEQVAFSEKAQALWDEARDVAKDTLSKE